MDTFDTEQEYRPPKKSRSTRVRAVRVKKKRAQRTIEFHLMPFMTGSQVYGTPVEGSSDIDLVMIMTPEKAEAVQAAFLAMNPNVERKPYGDEIHIKSGCLNLIICTQPKNYHAWLRATEEAKQAQQESGPLSKEQSKLLFRKFFSEFGLEPLAK